MLCQIQFSEYSVVDIPDAWKGDRNPVKYAALREFGIDPAKLKWKPMPEADERREAHRARTPSIGMALTMAEAKKGRALTFGVAPERSK